VPKRALVVLTLVSASACVSKRFEAPRLLPTTAASSRDGLIEHVNRRREVRSLTAAAELSFEALDKVEQGEARRFRKTDARLLLARPARVRLEIQLPLLKTSLAAMASDGTRFQLLVHPVDYRAFIEGSASGNYSDQARKLARDPLLRKAGPLVNVRPQHIAEAFLFEPISLGDDRMAVSYEARETEVATGPGAKRGERVVRSYYVLDVIEGSELRFRYWFDRTTPRLELRRKQVYGPEGQLATEVRFEQYEPNRPERESFPTFVRLERPKEAYAISLTLKPESITLNRDLPETAFVVTVPAEWEGSIRRINLDAPH